MSAFHSANPARACGGCVSNAGQNFYLNSPLECKLTKKMSTVLPPSCYANSDAHLYFGERYSPYMLAGSRTVPHFADQVSPSFARCVRRPWYEINNIPNYRVTDGNQDTNLQSENYYCQQALKSPKQEMLNPWALQAEVSAQNFSGGSYPDESSFSSRAFVDEYVPNMDKNHRISHTSSTSEFSEDSLDTIPIELLPDFSSCQRYPEHHSYNFTSHPESASSHEFGTVQLSGCRRDIEVSNALPNSTIGTEFDSSKRSLSQRLLRKRIQANQQERKRMHRMNNALDRLRLCLPWQVDHNTRLSKIKTLKLAIRYIASLSECLKDGN